VGRSDIDQALHAVRLIIFPSSENASGRWRRAYRNTIEVHPCSQAAGLHRGEEPCVAEWDFRRDHVRIFELHLTADPRLRIDGREIVAARFVEPESLLAVKGIPPFIRDYLASRG
jgi:hypothetical protein